jgi:hypothetical protein
VLRQKHTQYPQNQEGRAEPDNIADIADISSRSPDPVLALTVAQPIPEPEWGGKYTVTTPIAPLDQLINLVETALQGARFLGVQPKGWLLDRGVGLDLPPLVRAVRKSIGECGSGQPFGTELHHLELRRALSVDARL